jgi:hypothetical protein
MTLPQLIQGCLSNRTALSLVFKMVEAAQKSWRRRMATTSCQNSFST